MNKQNIIPILLAIAAVFIVTKVYGQDVSTCQPIAVIEFQNGDSRQLIGTIIDEQGQPVAYANVAILNPESRHYPPMAAERGLSLPDG